MQRTSTRPDLGPAPSCAHMALSVLAALRALGLVLVAEAVARDIAGLAAGTLSAGSVRAILMLGVGGALLRAAAEWATETSARRVATAAATGGILVRVKGTTHGTFDSRNDAVDAVVLDYLHTGLAPAGLHLDIPTP